MKHKNDLFLLLNLMGRKSLVLEKISVGLVTVALGTTFF